MKKGKRTIGQGTNLFSDSPSNQPQQSTATNNSNSNNNDMNTNVHNSQISTYINQKSSTNRTSNIVQSSSQISDKNNQLSQTVDEKKKRLQMLRQKYLKKDKKNIKEQKQQKPNPISPMIKSNQNYQQPQQAHKVQHKNYPSEIHKQKISSLNQIKQQNQQQPIEKPIQVQQSQSQVKIQLKTSQIVQKIEQKNEQSLQKIEKKTVGGPPPRRGPGAPPPPIRKPVNRNNKPSVPVMVKQLQQQVKNGQGQTKNQSNFAETPVEQPNNIETQQQQRKQQSIIKQHEQKQVLIKPSPQKKNLPQRKVPLKAPCISERKQNKPSQSFESQYKNGYSQKNLNEQIDQWLKFNKNQKNEKPKQQKQNQLIRQISEVLTKQNNLIGGFLLNFVIKSQTELKSHQIDFISSVLIEIQQKYGERQINIVQKYDALLLIAIKCGYQILKHYPIPHSSQWGDRIARINEYKEFLSTRQKQNLINYIIEQGTELNWNTIYQIIRLMPNYYNLGIFSNKITTQSPNLIVRTLKNMKDNLNQKNIGFYFKLLNGVLSFVDDSGLMEGITKHIQSININGSYQLKKDALLKAIQYMPEENKRSNGNDNHLEKTRSQEDEKGINLMGFVNQAIKKIKSQVPEKKDQEQDTPKDSIVWDEELKRYVINGVVPEDDSAPVVTQQSKKAPPPPPPRVPKKVSQNPSKPEPRPSKKRTNIIQPVSGFQQQTKQKPALEEKQSQICQQKPQQMIKEDPAPRKVLPPPPPPRMGGKKPKIQARYT